jgi:replicative DNA helicase
MANKNDNKNQTKNYKKRVVIPAGVRIPPQNLDAEKSILGASLLDKKSLIKIIYIFTSQDFYEENHGMIF